MRFGGLCELENRATDLEVFGAAGGLRDRTELQLRVWCFSASEHHSRGQERVAANFERWKQPQRASSQSCALDPLQQLSPNTLPGSPPLTGEEPWLVYLSYKQLFIMKNFKHTQNKQKSLMNPRVLIVHFLPLSTFTDSYDICTSIHWPLPIQ